MLSSGLADLKGHLYYMHKQSRGRRLQPRTLRLYSTRELTNLKPYQANKCSPSSQASLGPRHSVSSSDTSLRTSLSQCSSWSSVSVSPCNQNQDHTIGHLSVGKNTLASFVPAEHSQTLTLSSWPQLPETSLAGPVR